VEAQPTGNVRTVGFLGPPPSAGDLVMAQKAALASGVMMAGIRI
jgi:hypothetical protein